MGRGGGELVLCENYQVENLQQNQRIIRQSKKNTSLKKRKLLSSLIFYIAVKNDVWGMYIECNFQ